MKSDITEESLVNICEDFVKTIERLTAERDALQSRNAKLEKVLEAADKAPLCCDVDKCVQSNCPARIEIGGMCWSLNLKSALDAAKE